MDKNELKSIILDQNEKLLENDKIIQREILKEILSYKDSNLIIILTGLRRAGKSTIINLLKNKTTNKNFYINFDDFRLIEFELKDFQKLNEIFLEQGNIKELYFDEIQNIKYWERYVRTMYDNSNKLYITGSNATMLSTELGTHLTGRNIPITIYPFSFREFLLFNNFKYKKDDIYITSKKIKFQKYFNEYLIKGGIPEYLKNKKEEYLKFIYEDIINRDIISRYSIINTKALKELLYYLVSNVGKEFSYSKLTSIVGVKHSTTIKEYIEYFENSYLIFTLPKFDYSLKKQIINPKKVYTIDTGLANSISFKFSQDRGKLLENCVFIELKRRNYEIYYHKSKKECDFVVRHQKIITQAIQVTTSLDNFDTKKREIEGLLDACKYYNLEKGLILTENEEGEFEEESIKIEVKPIWKWLLSETQ